MPKMKFTYWTEFRYWLIGFGWYRTPAWLEDRHWRATIYFFCFRWTLESIVKKQLG